MLKPSREETIKKLITVYKEFSPGSSLIKPMKESPAIIIKDPSDKEVKYWTNKDYSHYFAFTYKNHLNLEYKLSYESDTKIINQLLMFLKSLGVDHQKHCKNFISWCFDNKEMIMKRSQYMTLNNCKEFINEYLQYAILEIKKEDSHIEYDYLSDLNKLFEEKKMLIALKRYGIVIVSSYLFYSKNFSVEKIIENIKKLNLETEDYEKISRTTILRSPYFDKMIMKDWRQLFNNFKFEDANWWRTNDYLGNPHKNYKELINE